MDNMKKLNHKRLAEGEVTGHFHGATAEDVVLYGDAAALADPNEGVIVMDAPSGTDVTHQEHDTVTLPPGQYERGIVREWDHFAEEARRVAD